MKGVWNNFHRFYAFHGNYKGKILEKKIVQTVSYKVKYRDLAIDSLTIVIDSL